jgi:DNA recombination protein RmuC
MLGLRVMSESTVLLIALLVAAAFIAIAGGFMLARRNAGGGEAVARLEGQLAQLGRDNAEMRRSLDERLAGMSTRLGETLNQQSERTHKSLTGLMERLAVIDQAQANIKELSGHVVGLQDVLSNKQARGAFGEAQLADILQDALPREAYGLQVTLGNGSRADCLIRLPNPPGPIAIDAKFPLEGFRQLMAAEDEAARVVANRSFSVAVRKHIVDIAEKYILPGETGDWALMFLPSERV